MRKDSGRFTFSSDSRSLVLPMLTKNEKKNREDIKDKTLESLNVLISEKGDAQRTATISYLAAGAVTVVYSLTAVGLGVATIASGGIASPIAVGVMPTVMSFSWTALGVLVSKLGETTEKLKEERKNLIAQKPVVETKIKTVLLRPDIDNTDAAEIKINTENDISFITYSADKENFFTVEHGSLSSMFIMPYRLDVLSFF